MPSTENKKDMASPAQILTFQVGGQIYGLGLLSVVEIGNWSEIRPLPAAPHYIAGVINVRGTALSVVDMGIFFKERAQRAEKAAHTSIILVDLGAVRVGLLVDRVCDIVSMQGVEIQPVPAAGGRESGKVLSGLAIIGDDIIGLLDLPAFGASIELPNVTANMLNH